MTIETTIQTAQGRILVTAANAAEAVSVADAYAEYELALVRLTADGVTGEAFRAAADKAWDRTVGAFL